MGLMPLRWRVGGDFLKVYYRDVAGKVDQLLLDRSQESQLQLDAGLGGELLPGNGEQWKLAAEGLRLRQAALLDPMLAVSHSTLQPLPHQIKAVYGEFLPRTH